MAFLAPARPELVAQVVEGMFFDLADPLGADAEGVTELLEGLGGFTEPVAGAHDAAFAGREAVWQLADIVDLQALEEAVVGVLGAGVGDTIAERRAVGLSVGDRFIEAASGAFDAE